jgi:DNA polymerase III epsilon subunit-like protein
MLSILQGVFFNVDHIVCHNLEFDLKMCDRLFKHQDYRPSDIDTTCTMTHPTVVSHCGLVNASGKPKWPKLIELYEILFGTPYEGAHSALGDTLATMKCHQELIKLGVIS